MSDELEFPIQTSDDGQAMVDARELHQRLGSKRQFANWIKERIDKAKLKEGEHFTSFNKIVKRAFGAATSTEYALTLYAASHVSMLETNDIGYAFRDYFIQKAQQHSQLVTAITIKNLPNDKLCDLIVYQNGVLQEKEEQITELLPKAQVTETFLERASEVDLRDFIASSGIIKANKGFALLRKYGYLLKDENHNRPKSVYTNYLGCKPFNKEFYDGSIKTTWTPTVKPEGFTWMLNVLKNLKEKELVS